MLWFFCEPHTRESGGVGVPSRACVLRWPHTRIRRSTPPSDRVGQRLPALLVNPAQQQQNVQAHRWGAEGRALHTLFAQVGIDLRERQATPGEVAHTRHKPTVLLARLAWQRLELRLCVVHGRKLVLVLHSAASTRRSPCTSKWHESNHGPRHQDIQLPHAPIVRDAGFLIRRTRNVGAARPAVMDGRQTNAVVGAQTNPPLHRHAVSTYR